MTESEVLKIIKDYLIRHKFNPERLKTNKVTNGKCPDYIVKENTSNCFYCEVKSPLLTQNPITEMFHWTTSISKLRDFIHTAVKQFTNINPKHNLPWVVIFTSDHFQLNWTNFTHCIQGIVAYNGKIIKDLRKMRFIKDTDKDVLSVDLFIWLQINSKDKKIYQLKLFVNKQSPLFAETKRISDLITPYKEENTSH